MAFWKGKQVPKCILLFSSTNQHAKNQWFEYSPCKPFYIKMNIKNLVMILNVTSSLTHPFKHIFTAFYPLVNHLKIVTGKYDDTGIVLCPSLAKIKLSISNH